MYQAVILGTLENFEGFFFADQAVRPGLGIVDGIVVDVHAHILFQVAAAFSHQPSGTAAGTGPHGNGPRVVNDFCHFVVTGFAGVVFNGTLHRDDAHQVHADVHERRQHRNAHAGVSLKALAEHRILVALLPVGENAFHNTGYPDGVVPAFFSVDRTGTDHAGGTQFVQLFPCKIEILFCPPCDFFSGAVGFQTHMHHDLAHVVIDNRLQNLVLRIIVGDSGVSQAFQADLGSQF